MNVAAHKLGSAANFYISGTCLPVYSIGEIIHQQAALEMEVLHRTSKFGLKYKRRLACP